jgi:hypothetical protein
LDAPFRRQGVKETGRTVFDGQVWNLRQKNKMTDAST